MNALANIASMNEPLEFSCHRALEEIGPAAWNDLWSRAEAATVFSRYEWANAWWQSLGGGRELRVYVARIGDELVGLIPLAVQVGRGRAEAVLVGDPHADYAALLVDSRHIEVFPALLDYAAAEIPTMRLREVRSDSFYATALSQRAASRLSRWRLAGSMPCPRSTLSPERTQQLVNKQSLKRHARKLAKRGVVEVLRETESARILPLLDGFFAQHMARWEGTDSPSLFHDPADRLFYIELVKGFSGTGLLVYTEIRLDERAVACHLGFVSEGDFIWYKPSFDPELAECSPGETLLRELILFADNSGLAGFDFTRGGEAFKRRFADHERLALSFTQHSSVSTAILARAGAYVRGRLGRTPAGAWLKRLLRRGPG